MGRFRSGRRGELAVKVRKHIFFTGIKKYYQNLNKPPEELAISLEERDSES